MNVILINKNNFNSNDFRNVKKVEFENEIYEITTESEGVLSFAADEWILTIM